ncbi:arabinan endo-1,5-alpha-L-arabinosidase [Aspergillus ibericus CBS 121593]|uniref:Endo-1,5-alpha-L-arabinosidase n=1 Tax=Aspergillus ibericus CBS 121593 TaxID=1448316 RepID=A0A395GL47_9EURO|nr:endo-1,5-alpha-L-arabinosidase [Aspergillus ibericus CBS 121593]RAK96230.1 endo-1,5-alpha-L-arabinosidase [Aspergillus ibericus CBS 121593]
MIPKQWPQLPWLSFTASDDSSISQSPLTRPLLRRILKAISLLTLFSLLTYALYTRYHTPSPSQDTELLDDTLPEYDGPFPPTHITDLHIHDPSIIRVNDIYYSYGSGPHIPIHTAPHLSGPWTKAGTVLDGPSILPKGDLKAPWAPTTLSYSGTYYCFYATSNSGCRNSAIGVATSSSPGPNDWTDHGPLALSGAGKKSTLYPFDRANAIDVSVILDHATDQGYMNFGSFWTGLWQVPLQPGLLAIDKRREEARHLAFEPTVVHPPGKKADGICGDPTGMHPIEGPFISYRKPWYYLWFSWGKCCHFDPEKLPAPGMEYSIRLGRSASPRGPFVDKQGRDLVDGGGEIIYGSNGDVYAPGGQGVLTDESGGVDVLYYHYCIPSSLILSSSLLVQWIGFLEFKDARLGYNIIKYVDGWPVLR